MSDALPAPLICDSTLDRVSGETLTAAQWAQLLGLSKKAFALRRMPSAGMVQANGGLTKVYRFSDLPADYRERLEDQRSRQAVPTYGTLLGLHQEPLWQPARELATLPTATQTLAERRKRVLATFWQSLEKGRNAGQANVETQAAWLREFGAACSEKTIRRWVAAVESRGGPDLAPLEAYAGLKSEAGKSVPHVAARREVKLGIPPELIAAYKAGCVQEGVIHMEASYRALEIQWMSGQPVPGLGVRPFQGAPFPFTAQQLRPFAPTLAARRLGGLGRAAAEREALPHGHNTTALLRRMERVLLDDSRVDIICTHDSIPGRLVTLKSVFLMDLGPRRIESYVVRESGAMRAEDTDEVVARALRSAGMAPAGASYCTTIRFERGAVACSPARQAFLEGMFPGRIRIERTGMNGGRAYAGSATQSGSGRWMDKAHIESFMRTLAFFVQHVPGQRGGSYARQPAPLGLLGVNRQTGALGYTRNSLMHQAALMSGAEGAVALYEGDLDERLQAGNTHQPEAVNGRLSLKVLYPMAWVLDAIRQFVAYYNSRTRHRMEGFRRIEFQREDGTLGHRKESPNERAAALFDACRTEQISEATMSRLLLRARPVTVRRNGVTLDLAPYEKLNFWRSDSICCHRAGVNSTGERQMIALLDEDGLRDTAAGLPGGAREIYLLGCRTVDEVRADAPVQFLEALPLTNPGVINDPLSLARSNQEREKAVFRTAAELTHAAAPHIARRAVELDQTLGTLQAVTVANDGARRATMPEGELSRDLGRAAAAGTGIIPADGDDDLPTRAAQMHGAEDSYAARMAALMNAEDDGE